MYLVLFSGMRVELSFQCKKCKLTFCSYRAIHPHIASGHKRQFCFCAICKPVKGMSNKVSLISILQHKKKSMKKTQHVIFYCELCHEKFNNIVSFKAHQLYCTMKEQNPKHKITKQYFNRTLDSRNLTFGQRNINNVEKDNGKIVPYIKVIQKKVIPVSQPKTKYECSFCGNVYATLHTRLRHEAGYCKKNPNIVKTASLYPCEKCNKQFTSIETLNFHTKMYCYDRNQEMKFECTKCKKKFPLKHMLQHHFQLRHARVLYCDYCQRSFNNKHHLARHILGHTGMKPFKCNICRQKFSRKCKLQLHLQRHSKNKDYSCNVCNKEFRFKNVFEKHKILICSEENIKKYPYLCDICKKRYENKKLIQKHMVNIHIKKFPCHICDKVYGQKFKLEFHLKTHRKKYFCSVCKKRFRTKNNFLHHKASHNDYPCECGQTFYLRYDYYRHRTYWCPKTAGKPVDEILKSDALLSKIDEKDTNTESVKAKKKYSTIKTTRKAVDDKVKGDNKKKTDGGKKNVRGIKANNTGQESTDSEDNYCLRKLATATLKNKSSDIEVNENNEVVRDIKKILRKRINSENSTHDICKISILTNGRNKVNENENNSNISSQTITTRNDDYFRQKFKITKNVKIILSKIN